MIKKKKKKDTEFSYDEETGRGPSVWGELNPSWYLCGNGTRQSPISISDSMALIMPDLGDLQINYNPATATLYNKGHDIQVINSALLFISGNDFTQFFYKF